MHLQHQPCCCSCTGRVLKQWQTIVRTIAQAAEALEVAGDFTAQAERMRAQVEAEQRLGGLLSRLRAAEQAADADLQVRIGFCHLVPFRSEPCGSYAVVVVMLSRLSAAEQAAGADLKARPDCHS